MGSPTKQEKRDARARRFAAVAVQTIEAEIRRMVRDEIDRYAHQAVTRALEYHRIREAGR